MSFVKLYGSILDSSIWSADLATRVVWITLLAMADRHGMVAASVDGIARRANVPEDATEAALAVLVGPDRRSKSLEHDGRRVEQVSGGWLILNYARYRELDSSTDRVRRFRDRQRDGTPVTVSPVSATGGNESFASTTDSDSVVEGEVQEREALVAGHRDYRTRLAVAANKGLGHEIPRIMPDSASSYAAADLLLAADIPVEFAEQVVFERAQGSRERDSIRSLGYFTRAVVEAWQRKDMAERVAGSSLRERAEPARVQLTAACPFCRAAISADRWSSHFPVTHPGEDVPTFAPHLIRV